MDTAIVRAVHADAAAHTSHSSSLHTHALTAVCSSAYSLRMASAILKSTLGHHVTDKTHSCRVAHGVISHRPRPLNMQPNCCESAVNHAQTQRG